MIIVWSQLHLYVSDQNELKFSSSSQSSLQPQLKSNYKIIGVGLMSFAAAREITLDR